MSIQGGSFEDGRYGNEGEREVFAWVQPETKRLVDVAYEREGYESRSAFVRAVLRKWFDLPPEEKETAVSGNNAAQTLLTDGGTSSSQPTFDLSDG